MRSAQVFSLIALVGSALAAPQQPWEGNQAQNVNVVYETVTVTVKGPKPADATSAPQQTWSATQVAQTQAAKQTWAAAKPSSAPVANDGSWQSIVTEWRGKMGLSAFNFDDKLTANALKTCQDGNGDMVHELNPGTMGQVLAPGKPDEFLKVFVGGWLCEMPNDSGMDGICGTMSAGWAYGGETGHAEILRGNYKNIGCACANGIWGCDVS